MTLRRQAFSGVRWTTCSSIGRTFLQVAQVSILARLLTPTDFGLLALVASVMAFAQIFADAGISNAIIHHQEISQKQLSSLYWLNVGVSLCLGLFLAVLSPLVAIWYAQPQMKLLLLIAGCTLVVGAFSQQLRVVAQKNLRFSELAKIELSSACVGCVVAVSAAYNGAGVYSLVAGGLATATIGSMLVWHRLADGWRPLYRINIGEIRDFLSFGAYMIGNNLANTFNSQIDIVLGGKILGAQAIGLYSMPRDLSLRVAGVINPIVTSVIFPVMAKAQHDIELLKRVYLQTIRMTASVNFPIYVGMALFSPEIVHILLGAKWMQVIPLLRVFAVWGLVRSTVNPIGSLLMACGRADLSFKWNVVLVIIVPPVVWTASQYGVVGMSSAMTALMVILYWPSWYFMVRPLCGARFGEYSAQVLIPLVLALLSVLFGWLIVLNIHNDVLKVVVGGLVGAVTYLWWSWRLNSVWADAMKEVVRF